MSIPLCSGCSAAGFRDSASSSVAEHLVLPVEETPVRSRPVHVNEPIRLYREKPMADEVEHIPVEHLPYASELVTRLPYTESALRTEITMAIGHASTCWSNLSDAGAFDSTAASKIAEDLIDLVIEKTGLGEPHLGCATTRELLADLSARVELGHGGLDYRTV